MSLGHRPTEIVDERVALDGTLLRVFARSTATFFRAELVADGGETAKVAPLVRLGEDYSATIDLGAVEPGSYVILLRASDGSAAAFGRLIAARQPRPDILQAGRKLVGVAARKIAGGTFPRADARVHGWVYVDPASADLHVRLSATDDIDAFLATLSASAAVSSDRSIRYSVVTPVYNVEPYLDQYFSSLTTQTLGFKSRIELVLVDDGSTDRSAKVIKRWQRKYPRNIRYVFQPNAGVAAARNLGLKHASHDWVTFIDPDDFVDREYFEHVDEALGRHAAKPVCAVVCNQIFYRDAIGEYSDSHHLRFKFAEGEKLVPIDNLGRFIQFSAATCFVRRSALATHGLEFDEHIRPTFEDGHLLNRYFLRSFGSFVLHVPSAKYFYRRRGDQSSLVQSGSRNVDWYGDQLQHGYLALLRDALACHGHVPAFIQNLVICDLHWRFEAVVDRGENAPFLNDGQRTRFGELLTEIFALIDDASIVGYDVSNFPYAYRMGVLNLFKGRDPPRQVVEVSDFDAAKGLAKLCLWSRNPAPSVSFRLADVEAAPAFVKARRRDFLGDLLVWEHIHWLPLSGDRLLRVFVDGAEARIDIAGEIHHSGVSAPAIRAAFRKLAPAAVGLPDSVMTLRRFARSPGAVARFRDAWLFIDRDAAADDNAEHLYRHVRRRHPEINAFFIVRRKSGDWPRLETEGFRLLPFGEPDHLLALLNASRLISSQADLPIWNYLGNHQFRDLLNYKFAFLQHGVTKDDISSWLNGMPIDLMVTSTQPEFDSIVRPFSPYKFSEKETVLTGFPRHDALAAGEIGDDRLIVLMPTWREGLSGKEYADRDPASPNREFTRAINPAFYASEFAKRWKRLVHSERLAAVAASTGCKVVFVPHQHLLPYLDFFAIPESIEVRSFGGGQSIQRLLQRLSVFVTDYSSLAFDVAYLDKPVVYYQFDRASFFGGGHMYRRGYFDYDRDGFGPVCEEEERLIAAIEQAAALRAVAAPPYRERAAGTFAFHDGKCCERVFQAILALDRPYVPAAEASPLPAPSASMTATYRSAS